MSCGARPTSDLFSKRRSPPLGVTRPVMARRLVVFPAPLAPIRLTIAPAETWKEIPLTASTVP